MTIASQAVCYFPIHYRTRISVILSETKDLAIVSGKVPARDPFALLRMTATMGKQLYQFSLPPPFFLTP